MLYIRYYTYNCRRSCNNGNYDNKIWNIIISRIKTKVKPLSLDTKLRYYPSQQSNKIMRMTSPLQYRHTHPVPQQYGGKLPTYNNIIILVHHRLGSETHHPNHIMKFLGLVTLLIVFLDFSQDSLMVVCSTNTWLSTRGSICKRTILEIILSINRCDIVQGSVFAKG